VNENTQYIHRFHEEGSKQYSKDNDVDSVKDEKESLFITAAIFKFPINIHFGVAGGTGSE
jgi:hypothetical protein